MISNRNLKKILDLLPEDWMIECYEAESHSIIMSIFSPHYSITVDIDLGDGFSSQVITGEEIIKDMIERRIIDEDGKFSESLK